MTQEYKELLLKDLSSRLPYGVKVKTPYNVAKLVGIVDRKGVRKDIDYTDIVTDNQTYPLRYCQPYLRPMSSMTEEEDKEYTNIDNRSYSCPKDYAHIPASDRIDWLNIHHFDYRNLIEKGLALKAPKELYNY